MERELSLAPQFGTLVWPTSTVAGIILPGCGLVLGYRLARSTDQTLQMG
jgi:hypothetical protein